MRLTLASLTRLLGIYYRFRPIITALFFSFVLVVNLSRITAQAQVLNFTLQIASCDSRPEAESLVAQLQSHGIQAEVSLSEVAARGTVFRVRAGKFTTVGAAREVGEQWRAASWINSYWVVKAEKPASLTEAAATAANATRKRIVAPDKILPEMSLGELVNALSDKWVVRVPENLKIYTATIIFPKAKVLRPAIVFMDEARLRSLSAPNLKPRNLMHPLELRFEPGIKNSPFANSLSFTDAERLAASLRGISGFRDLTFDERGILVTGNRIEGGSDLARVLLRAALESNEPFEIESQEGSDLVVFGAYMSANYTTPEKKPARINKIQLDFHDFEELRGDPRLLEAFDPGFVFLHELAHGIWDLPDDERGGLGECEAYINQIRRQLGLPERLSYFYKVRRPIGGNEYGEMMFFQPAEGTRRRQSFKLIWDNRAVNSYIKPAVAEPASQKQNTSPK